jgi:hypothetical protein
MRDENSLWHRWRGVAVVALAAVVATLPLAIRGTSCGHDFDFHLVSWLDALDSWRQGVLYPHWTPSANYGAGEPRFVFYPPLTWMLGAALGALMRWEAVPIALSFLLLAGTGLATRALARQALAEGPATLAGCAAIFSGYALFTAYERSAFGELAGGIWIPLMLLLALRGRGDMTAAVTGKRALFHEALDGSTAPLALVVAGAWLSNAPVGVMTCYLLAAVAVVAAGLARSWAPLLRASVGAALGMGLAAFYVVPAAWEQRWVDIRQATADPGEMIENSWLFARHAGADMALHDVELRKVSILAVTMIAVALLGLLVSWRRRTLPVAKGWWVPLALIPVGILLLLLPISLPVWNVLPKLRFLQFPWRWLVALEAPMALFFAAAVWTVRGRRRGSALIGCGVLFVAASATAGMQFFQYCDEDDRVSGMLDVYASGAGFQGTDEYAPPGADNSLLASNLPAACLVDDPDTTLGAGDPNLTPEWTAAQHSCVATFEPAAAGGRPRAEHVRMVGNISTPGYLVLKLRSYPAWQVKVNGRTVTGLPARQDGLMAVPVAQGPVTVAVDWTTTRDVLAGRWVSGVFLVLLAGLCLLESRWRRAGVVHLS